MAKDPAFLFYPGDWLGGTMGMTFEQKGAYLELLVFQFNNGRFSKTQAEQVLSICFASVWQVVNKKFKSDGLLYWNERLELEIARRKRFSESRRDNAKGGKSKDKPPKAYAEHMENENEIEDINSLIEWGKLIIENRDQYWEQMRGRKISQKEMDNFISVAVRNKWKLKTAQEFRYSLKGFDTNLFKSNGQKDNNPGKMQ